MKKQTNEIDLMAILKPPKKYKVLKLITNIEDPKITESLNNIKESTSYSIIFNLA